RKPASQRQARYRKPRYSEVLCVAISSRISSLDGLTRWPSAEPHPLGLLRARRERPAGRRAPMSVMNAPLFIDRIASDPPSRECMAEYRIGKDQFNVTDEGIIFLREATPVSTWTEDDKRIATRALKTLEEASVASRGAAIYYLEPV